MSYFRLLKGVKCVCRSKHRGGCDFHLLKIANTAVEMFEKSFTCRSDIKKKKNTRKTTATIK